MGKDNLNSTQYYTLAANAIKEAILSAQYEAAKGVNDIQLMLYYAVGRFIAANSRKGHWGTNAIGSISRILKSDMPGLRGFSETNMKRMRTFYEEWRDLDSEKGIAKPTVLTGGITSAGESTVLTGEITDATVIPITPVEIAILPFNFPAIDYFPASDFRSIGFTHHSEILAKCKTREERLFYISLCAREHLTPDG